MPSFPGDWYWRADDGRLYSSSRKAVVANPDDDAAFAAWSQSGVTPTRWPGDEQGTQSDASLREVLMSTGVIVPRLVTPLEFLERLSQEKRIIIRTAARQEGGETLGDWLDLLLAAQIVDLDDARTVNGVATMEAAGLLTQAEADALLA